MAELSVSESRPASGGKTVVRRLFVLELNADRVHSMNVDGSDRKTIVTDCHLPDGIVVDAEAGHIYWTNMGVPTSTTVRSNGLTWMAEIAESLSRKASPTRRNRSISIRK